MRFYLLRGHEVVVTEDVMEWALGFGEHNIVAQDQVGPDWVSTVFVGINYRWHGDGPPLVFETMVFPDTRTVGRWATWDEALEAHTAYVMLARVELQSKTN